MQEPERSDHPSLKVIAGVILLGFLLALTMVFMPLAQVSKLRLFLGEFMIIVPALIYLRSQNYDLRAVFRLNGVPAALLGLVILMSLGVTVLVDEIDRLMRYLVTMPPELEGVLEDLLRADSFLDWLLLIGSAVFLAGLLEEMLFRGLLLKAMERRFEVPYAIFFTSLVFALFHPSPWLVQILLLGFLLGFLAWRADSVLPSVVLHCSTNAFSLVQQNSEVFAGGWYTWNEHVNPPVVVAAVALTYYTLRAFTSWTHSEDIEN